jgi:hypothetical protein
MNPALGMTVCLATGLAILLLGGLLRVGAALRRGETLRAAVFGVGQPTTGARKARTLLLAVALAFLLTGGVLGLALLVS